jgi:hypothetical protein
MSSTTVSSSCSAAIFIGFEGNPFMLRDTCASGDCVLPLLLCNPNFAAPVSSSDELRRAVVIFARGECHEEYYTAYALVGDRNNTHYEVYLDQVLRPGFWVGTVFYIRASLAYGCNIRSHFFNKFREPKVESSLDFIKKYFMVHSKEIHRTVDVFFSTGT